MKLWIRIDTALQRDPEVWELAARLGVRKAEAIGLLLGTWSGIAEHRPSGDIADVSSVVLESWADFEPRGKAKRGAFAAAFVELFTRDGAVRGWKERQGKLIERMEKDRKRKGNSEELPRSFQGISEDIPRLRNDTNERNDTDEETTNFTAARASLVLKLPDDYRADLNSFLTSLGSVTRQYAWVKNLEAKLSGMHPPAVPPEVLGAAIRQLVGNGEAANWKRFEGYLRSEAAPPRDRSTGKPGGKTLAATKLISYVRARRNPQFPASVVPEWDNELAPEDSAIVKAFGIPRILNDPNEGTLVSQLAKALEEAAA